MSGIKLVAIDIDGTLLDPYGEITPRTKAAMEAVANLDIQIIISTGRRFWTAREKVTVTGIQPKFKVKSEFLILSVEREHIHCFF